MAGSLSDAQVRVLRALAGLYPRWTLSGGGALAGFHLGHRRTKDVDLFFHGLSALGRLPEDAAAALRADGMTVDILQRAPAFCRLRADHAGSVVVIDLVAEPVPTVFPPESRTVDSVGILVDSRAELLVNKLGALYSRSEIRDLVDVKALVDAGEDLEAALALARADGYPAAELVVFRDHLVERLLG